MAHDEVHEQLRSLAARQHGVVSRAQARALGLGTGEIRWLVERGTWRAVGGRALILAGSPPTHQQRALTAVLAASTRAVLSHDSAAALWGWERFHLLPVHVMAPYGASRSHPAGVVVHRTRRLLDHHVIEVDGFTITTPARTVYDLSGTLRPLWRIEDALDDAWAAGSVNFDSLSRVIDEMSGRGQRNVAQLRSLVEERGPAHVPGDSALERRLHRILAGAGLPPLDRQVDLIDEEGWWGRVDGVYRDAALVVEVDGDRWHSALSHRRRDEERRAQWEAMGFVVLRIREYDVWHRPEHVVAQISELRRHRLGAGRRAA